MKWVQFINSYQKSAPGRPMTVCLAALLSHVLPRHTNILTDKGFNLFDESAARAVLLSPLEEDYTSYS